jgi:hypothetical protein
MQDSVDLGWKLAAVVEGWGGQHLLDSYEPERRPVALRNVEEASENLRRMLSPRLKLSRAVFEKGTAGEIARREFGDAYTEMMKREWFTLHIHLGYIYENSPIIWSDGTPAPNDPVMTYIQTARPGSRAPHVWLSSDRSTLDLFGREFVLLKLDTKLHVLPFVQAAEQRGVPFKVVELQSPEVRSAYVNNLVLVRPDGFVCWRSDKVPANPLGVIDRVRGEVTVQARKNVSLPEQVGETARRNIGEAPR